MSPQDIRQLTFGKLKELDGAVATSVSPDAVLVPSPRSTPSPFGDGTQVVYSKELMPKEAIIRMKSAELADSKKRAIFFVSPIEGFVTALERLAERLDCPVYGLQCTSEAPLNSTDELAAFYIKHVRSVQPKGPYSIVGYSFGCLSAFVMAAKLEKTKEISDLEFLDGLPKYVNWYTQSNKQRHNLQNDIHQNEAFDFGLVCANLDTGVVGRLLMSIPTCEQKVVKIAELLSVELNQPKELIVQAATAFYRKLYLADTFETTLKLAINVTLIKPTENYAKLSADYDLKEFFLKKIEILTVEGNFRLCK